MIWLTWRQQRLEALIGAAILILVAIFLIVTGLNMASTYQQLGVSACVSSHSPACGDIINAFRNQYGALFNLVVWLNLLPLIFGVLLAAPFVLELEQGTYRLAWTQSVTRTRWVSFKLGLLIGAALLISVALTALLTWWQAPFVRLDGPFQPRAFDVEGTVLLAYTVFAVALGLGVGTLLRRTVPAVAISLVTFLVLRLSLENLVRPTYVAPVTRDVTAATFDRSSWILDSSLHDKLGHPVNIIDVLRACGTGHGNEMRISGSCLQQHGFFNTVTYQPGDRYWLFQGIETAIFLGLAVGLLALTVWWVRKRIA